VTITTDASRFDTLAKGAARIDVPPAIWNRAYRIGGQFIKARPFDSRYSQRPRLETNAYGLVGEWGFARWSGWAWDWPEPDQPHGDHGPDVGPYEVKTCCWQYAEAFRRLLGGTFPVPGHTEASRVVVLHLFTFDHRQVYLDGWIGTRFARELANEWNGVPYVALNSWRTLPRQPRDAESGAKRPGATND
jgi:hypothetical protein